MEEFTVTISAAERVMLVELLDSALRETLVEEHRTRNPTYREGIIHHEALIAGLLTRLKDAHYISE